MKYSTLISIKLSVNSTESSYISYFVCIAGFVIAMLSVTGLIIWMKKRRARANPRSTP